MPKVQKHTIWLWLGTRYRNGRWRDRWTQRVSHYSVGEREFTIAKYPTPSVQGDYQPADAVPGPYWQQPRRALAAAKAYAKKLETKES